MDQLDDVGQDALKAILEGRCAPELLTIYSRLSATMSTAGFTGHLEEFDVLTGKIINLDIDDLEVVQAVDEIIRTAADRCLGLLLITVDDDIDLEMLDELMDILLGWDPTDTPSILLDSMAAAESSEEKLAKMLSHLGTYEEDDWIPVLVSVDPDFNKRVDNELKRAMEYMSHETLPEGSPELLKRVARLNKALPDTLGAELGSMNAGIGVSLESLYSIHVGNLIDLSLEAAVTNVYSLAALGEVSLEAATSSVSRILDDLCMDIDDRRKAEQLRLQIHDRFKPIFGVEDE